jgi:ATP/maltotriose-dependent transcriptional regulator MalT
LLDISAKVSPPSRTGLVRDRLLRPGRFSARTRGRSRRARQEHTAGAARHGLRRPVAWYRADARDRHEAALTAHLGKALHDALGTPTAGATTVQQLIDALDAHRELRALLVVDDLHELVGTKAEEALGELISWAPAGLRVLLAARRAPTLNLTVLRLRGDASVIGEDDLRFRSREVGRLFRDVYGKPLRPEDAAAPTRRTDGWAAGLAMFHLLTT